jgi:hypothetical protein
MGAEGTSHPTVEASAALLRQFVTRAEARRGVALLDRGPGGPPVRLDCAAGEPVEVTVRDETVQIGPADEVGDLAFDLDIRPLPPMHVDPQTGEVIGTVGGIEYLGRAVRELARRLGGRSVATIEFATADEAVPMLIAARVGEPLVVVLGDQSFHMADGWPP